MPSHSLRRVPFLLTPYPYLLLFVFFILNSLHLYSGLLIRARFELLLTGAILLTSLINLFVFRSEEVEREDSLLLCLALFLLAAPLITSLWVGNYLRVTEVNEYRSWAKMLAVVPALYLFFKRRHSEALLNVILASLGVLAIVFWYRYGVLNEVREFDLRPVIQIKNGDPNFLCVLFGTVLPLVIYRMRSASRPFAIAYGALGALFLSVVLASESRMGLLSLGLGLLYLVALSPRKKLAAIGLAAFFALAVAFGGDRFAELNDRSNQMRLRTMETGAKLFTTAPLFGHGWDSAPKSFFPLTGYPRFLSETAPLQVHNTFLQLLAELGANGFLIYSGLLLFVFLRVYRGDFPYASASLLILFLNLLTLPLQNKDFVLLLAICLAALSTYRLHPNRST